MRRSITTPNAPNKVNAAKLAAPATADQERVSSTSVSASVNTTTRDSAAPSTIRAKILGRDLSTGIAPTVAEAIVWQVGANR